MLMGISRPATAGSTSPGRPSCRGYICVQASTVPTGTSRAPRAVVVVYSWALIFKSYKRFFYVMQPSLLPSIADNLVSFPQLLPEGLLAGTLVIVLTLAIFFPHYSLRPVAWGGLILAGSSKYWLGSQLGLHESQPLFNQLLVLDPLAIFFGLLLLIITWPLLLLVPPAAGSASVVLMLGGVLGSCWLVMAAHWLSIYLGVTLLALSSALLMSSHATPSGAAASLKYLLYSMATTTVMLWGMGYFYGYTGTLSLTQPAPALSLQALPEAITGIILLLCLSNILFVLAAAPYHFWMPDVYQNAPVAVVAYMATVPKLAAVAVLLRLFHQYLPQLGPVLYAQGQQGLAVLALLTIVVGNVAALSQNHLHRLLAYGGIAQGGLLIAGVVALPSSQVGLLYYSVLYGVTSLAAWAGLQVVQCLTGGTHLRDFMGLGREFPVLGISLTVVMFSLVGLPPTAGFTGKFLLFTGLWAYAQHTGSSLCMALWIASLLSTVLSLYYYLKLPYALFAPAPQQSATRPEMRGAAPILVGLLALLLLAAFGAGSSLLPDAWLR